MAKRGRKKKFKVSFDVSPETYRSMFAVLLLVFSAISLISFVAPDYLINSKLQLVFKKSFGYASFLIPFITAVSGLLFIEAIKARIKELRIIVGLVLLLISLSGFFHIFISNENAREMAIQGKGGGFIGYILSNVLESTISIYGGILVLIGIIAVAVILTLNVSIDQIILFFREKLFSNDLFKFGKKEEEGEIVFGGSEGLESGESSIPTGEANLGLENAAMAMKENSFKIVPSMSEPQSGLESLAVSTSKKDGTVATLAPSLPPVDKVWKLPPIDLLTDEVGGPPDIGNIQDKKRKIVETLKSFGIEVEIVNHQIGPTFTKFELKAPSGIRVSKISNLQNDLALALASMSGSVRVEAPIPGTSFVGIEVPNEKPSMVSFKSLITSDAMKNTKSKLAIVLGKDVGGVSHIYDIERMPHLLVAGATGSGKSIFIHNLLFSILYRATPQEVKLILIDPKRVELSAYRDIPHLCTPIVTDIEKTPAVFKWAVTEMTKRFKQLESAKVKDIKSYNEKAGYQAMPYILLIVDELAEIMIADATSVEKSIMRLGQLARATGIHLILAAQRPSADVITGSIKANIPCRVAFNVTKQVDSRVIIDMPGAEKLLGRGDMLFVPVDKPNPVRLQSAFISDKEVFDLVNYLKSQGFPPDYKDEILEMASDGDSGKSLAAGGGELDDHYDEALEIVVAAGKASASLLQRRLAIGYARAARIIDEMYEKGVVGPANGARPRDVLIDSTPISDGSISGNVIKPGLDDFEEETE